MPPRPAPKSKKRWQQTVTYNLSNASARDAFEQELEIEEEAARLPTAGRGARRGGRSGGGGFSLAADFLVPDATALEGGLLEEYETPKATADMINLLELFSQKIDRDIIENVYLECRTFETAMERLMEMVTAMDSTPEPVKGSDGGRDCADASTGAAGEAGPPSGTVAAQLACAGGGAAAAEPAAALTDGRCHWEHLPDDLKRHVFSFLSSRDLARVARTCQDFAGPARLVRNNTRQLQIPTGLGVRGIMAMVSGHPNARSVSLRQWASSPLSDTDFTALVVALSAGSRSERRAVPVEAVSFKGCRWLSDGQVLSLCSTMQHLKEVDLTDCAGITDAALVALSKYQRIAPKGQDASSSEDEAPPSAAACATPPLPPRQGFAGRHHQQLQQPYNGSGGPAAATAAAEADDAAGDAEDDDELQFAFEVTPAPLRAARRAADAAATARAPAAALAAAAGPSGAVAASGRGLGEELRPATGGEEKETTMGEASDDEGDVGGRGDAPSSANSDSGDEDEDAGCDADEGPTDSASELASSLTRGVQLSDRDGAAARTGPRLAAWAGGAPRATAAVPAATRCRDSSGGGAATDSASSTPLYGTSPAAGGLLASSYGAAAGSYGAAGRGFGSPWLYGTSPPVGSGGGGAAAAAARAAGGTGTKSWLYGSSPVMGASPFFRTGGSSSIAHNGWLARAASAATHHHSGRGLMSLNLSGCSSISSDGVRALLAAPLPKACLLQLDISRCPRITRAALALPATSNLCVLRASACHNLHEVIMQLPLSSPLTELHLADCKALSKLHVVAPALQTLHVGSCRHLTRLHLRCPQLRQLTASLCFRLSELDCERWEVGRLERLNLFGCRHLGWLGLATLLARCGPSLRHLDINGCNAIVEADIPPVVDGLQHLDASGCKSLLVLRCASPLLTGAALRSCPRLQELSLQSAALEWLDITNCPHLQRLSLPALAVAARERDLEPAPLPAVAAAAAQQAAGVAGAAPPPPPPAAPAAAAATGLAVRMAGCDRLPPDVAGLLRRLRERARQAAAAAARRDGA